MKAKLLLEKFRVFRDQLEDHYALWCKSLGRPIPDFPVRNREALMEQQKQLFKLFYELDEYITLFSKGRLMRHPMTGIRWEAYRASIGNDVSQIKGPSAQNVLLELEGIIGLLEQENSEKEIVPNHRSAGTDVRVFVSHGRETEALIKAERFLRGLGIRAIIVKNEPSLGKALDDLVEEQMDSCSATIILATKDDRVKDSSGREYFQLRPNVIHEIGLAQEKHKDRIIYLKEKGCTFPSNISPKVWEDFTQDNMEGAFLKIAKELKAFGLI